MGGSQYPRYSCAAPSSSMSFMPVAMARASAWKPSDGMTRSHRLTSQMSPTSSTPYSSHSRSRACSPPSHAWARTLAKTSAALPARVGVPA